MLELPSAESNSNDMKKDGDTENSSTSKVGTDYDWSADLGQLSAVATNSKSDWTDWVGTGAGIAAKFVPYPLAKVALSSLGPALKASKWMFKKGSNNQIDNASAPPPNIPVETPTSAPQAQPITIYNQPQASNDRTWLYQRTYTPHYSYRYRKPKAALKKRKTKRTIRRKNKK